MTAENKISPQQLFCVLLMSELSSEIVYPVSSTGAGGEGVLAILLAELIRFALALPVIIYSFRGNAFYAAAYRRNRFFGWIAAVFAALLLVGAACRTLLYSAEFTQRTVIAGTSAAVIFVISAAFAVYAAVKGAEAMARTGVLFLVASGIITVAVMLADIPYMSFSEIRHYRTEYDGLFGDIVKRVLHGGDYLIFAALLPYVRAEKGSAGKTALFFSLFSTLGSILLFVFGIVSLREFYGHTEYPFAAAASLSDISLFKRLDGLGCAMWALCAALRAGLMLFGAYAAIKEITDCIRVKKAEVREAGA